MTEKSTGSNQSIKELMPFNFKAFGWKPLKSNTYLDEQLYLQDLIEFTEERSNIDFIFFNPDLCPDRVPIKEIKRQLGPSGKKINLILNNGFQIVFTNYFLWSNCLWLQDKLTNRLYPIYEYDHSDNSDMETFRRLWNKPILQIPRPYIQPGDILITDTLIDNKPVSTFSVIASYSQGESVWIYDLSPDSLKLSLREQKLNPNKVFRTL